MSKPDLNPHKSGTPEWQVYELWRRHISLARAHASDAERKMKMAEESRERAEQYELALRKCGWNGEAKNPYDQSMPEWQVFSTWKGQQDLVRKYAEEADDYTHRAAREREAAARAEAVLRKIEED